MTIVCLDMESVLTPEIWIAFSEASGIPELKRTTRDEPDYDKLMNWRLKILEEHGLGQLAPGLDDRVQGRQRILEDHRDFLFHAPSRVQES